MMNTVAFLAIIAVAYAASITLPVTQDFAVVNPGRSRTVIAKTDMLNLFNNGVSSSIPYFGFDLNSLLIEASITSDTIVSSIIASAELKFNNFTMLGDFGDTPIAVHLSALNPGQVWDEDAVTLSTTPTVKGSMGEVLFYTGGSPSLDVTNYLVDSLRMPYQGGMFGFQVGLPGGPVEVVSHRADPDSVVLEIEYNLWVGPGATAPPSDDEPSSSEAPSTTNDPVISEPPSTEAPATSTEAPSTEAPVTTTASPSAPSTSSAAPSTSTNAPAHNCWTCGAGYVHWYDIEGMAAPEDPCACVQQSSPTTAQPDPSDGLTTIPPKQSAPTSPERNSADKVWASALVLIVVVIALLL